MAVNDNISEVLRRNGTDQPSRTEENLNPENVELHGFGLQQWMEFAYDFAERVNYFTEENKIGDNAAWQQFFINKPSIEDFLSEMDENPDGSLTPHLTLFICFLKLLELSNDRLNKLTKRHLDFYYREVLQIENIAAQEDQAYIIFELAKRVSNHLVEEDVAIDGGKDDLGKKRVYKVKNELAVSKTSIAQIKSVYNEHNISGIPGMEDEERFYVKASSVANSNDGIGGDLSQDDPTWYPFGYYTNKSDDATNKELIEAADLPNAELGFAIASPILVLNEGLRTITVSVKLSKKLQDDVLAIDLKPIFQAHLTIHKKWLTSDSLISSAEFVASTDDKTILQLVVEVPTDEPAIVAFDQEFHGFRYVTEEPILRFLLSPNSESEYKVYKELAEESFIDQVDLKVDVVGLKGISLESDTGSLNPEKPFYPFTSRPILGSSFSFYNEEAFTKNWESISFSLLWKNTPISFKTYYAAYDKSFLGNVSSSGFLNWTSQFKGLGTEEPSGLLPVFDDSAGDPIVTGDDHFTADPFIKNDGEWKQLGTQDRVLFSDSTNPNEFKLDYDFGPGGFSGKTGPIRLKLSKSFLHDMFPKIYALALAANTDASVTDFPIPNEPYAPFAEEASIDYTATEIINLNSQIQENFENRTSKVYHEHPFGQNEIHAYLDMVHDNSSSSSAEEASSNQTLLPTYCNGGKMYIGLQDAELNELVTLFFQFAEGTENPLADTFVGNQKVKWEILANNVWRELEGDLLVENSVDNFLKTGRVQFTIPPFATNNNTQMEGGLFWVRASMHKRYDAVAKLFGVHAQATLVEFENKDNDLTHLETGLPAESLSKLVERTSKIKSIYQPYGTFGSKTEESDLLYYRRVSERLRHKNRGITLWDYEHLVLQEFPEVYKVKCLNHTSEVCYKAPGYVSLIVIPDTINKQVFDVYQPRMSQTVLNQIEAFLKPQISMHINLSVANPNYEEVKVEVSAKFYKGLDDNTYKLKLKEDITRFLSPWAFEESRSVDFGITLHQSALVHYIENLNYIDFIRDLRIFKDDELQTKLCSPSNPKSILVSAKHHTVNIASGCHEVETTDNTETCQL